MLKYWLWLTTRKGLGHRGAFLAAQHFHSAEAAYYAEEEDYASIPGLRNYKALLDKDLSLPQQILRQCYEKGIGILTYQDAAYPVRLKNIDDPPLVLYYRGTLPDFNGPALAVVGTRKASAYGLVHARSMGYGLSRCGCMVVSGGARGNDTMALTGALTGGTPAVAVLGCGVDVVYPPENRGLFEDICHYGCLISEYPPGTEALPAHFPVRNRIITGLSLGVLVVEANERSGSMISARHALEQGRDVFAIPAGIDTPGFAGNLRLLRDGAILVRDAWDILEEYVHLYPEQLRRAACKQLPLQRTDDRTAPETGDKIREALKKDERLSKLSQEERIVAETLKEGPKHIDLIVEEVQKPVSEVLSTLTMLEISGMVEHLQGRRYCLKEETA